jgi:hypothetical protein
MRRGTTVTTHLITQPYHLPRDGGPALWHLGAVLRFKATSEQTAGRMWVKELTAPRGMSTRCTATPARTRRFTSSTAR